MEEKTGKADKKEIRSRKNQKLYRSRFGKGGKIMKKLEIVIRPESLENLELLLEEQKANGMMITNILGYGNQKGYRQMYVERKSWLKCFRRLKWRPLWRMTRFRKSLILL